MLHVIALVITKRNFHTVNFSAIGTTEMCNKKRNDTIGIPKDLFVTLCNLLYCVYRNNIKKQHSIWN